MEMEKKEYETIHGYVRDKKYPDDSTPNSKRALRQKSENFIVNNDNLYFRGNPKITSNADNNDTPND